MKLALGTVQFGLKYGINNRNGVPDDHVLTMILEIAQAAGISVIDTAIAYGNAEERLGSLVKEKSSIVSKFPLVTTADELRRSCLESRTRLQTPRLYAYLAHSAQTLIRHPELWETLCELRSQDLIEKAGTSLYHPEELEQLHQLGIFPDLVQLPYSLLDRKFEPYFATLKTNNTEIHTRSAFLQGLYFKPANDLPKRLKALQPQLEALREIAADYRVSIESLALTFIHTQPAVDRIVIGVDSPEQLLSNLIALEQTIPVEAYNRVRTLAVPDPSLLNPSTWHA